MDKYHLAQRITAAKGESVSRVFFDFLDSYLADNSALVKAIEKAR